MCWASSLQDAGPAKMEIEVDSDSCLARTLDAYAGLGCESNQIQVDREMVFLLKHLGHTRFRYDKLLFSVIYGDT
jgi:hypothetical protein